MKISGTENIRKYPGRIYFAPAYRPLEVTLLNATSENLESEAVNERLSSRQEAHYCLGR